MSAAAHLRPPRHPSADHQVSSGSSEFEFLLACCAQPLNRGHLEGFLGCHYDWQTFMCLAEHHCVIPQVYRSLALYGDRLPAGNFAALRSRYQDNARSALWFTSELLRVLKHLECRGIAAIPLKGPVLARTLYGDVTARQFGDLDILIRPEDVTKAKSAVLQLGYKPALQLTALSEQACISNGHEFTFGGQAGPHLLELQWRIVPRFYSIGFDVASLSERAERVDVGGCSVATLSPDDLLLVLCVHAAKHLWLQLSWLCDIAELARAARINWETAWKRSRELGIQRIAAMNLLLAHDLLGSPLPRQIESWLAEDRETKVLKDNVSEIFERGSAMNPESPAYFRFMLRLRERLRDQIRLVWRLVWTPSLAEWSVVDLPESFSWLYRGIRLLRLSKRFAALAWARSAFFFASERPAVNPRSTTFS
jgi:hypothetical protein